MNPFALVPVVLGSLMLVAWAAYLALAAYIDLGEPRDDDEPL